MIVGRVLYGLCLHNYTRPPVRVKSDETPHLPLASG